jgi:ABC-2 type transport system ATP-binding protein
MSSPAELDLSQPAIVVEDLRRSFGALKAVDGVSFSINHGSVVGFVGANGAGKTTTMRIIATLLAPTWGEAYVCGNSVHTHPKEIRRLVGYMPDFFGV